MAHNTSTISARIPNATRRKLYTLAEQWNVAPSTIVKALLNMLPLRTYTAEQSGALSKILALLGLPDDATPDNIKDAINKLLGVGDPTTAPDGGGNEGAPESPDPELAPVVPLSEYGYKVPCAAEVGRVAAKLSDLSAAPTKPARVTPFVVDAVTNQVKVNPARYARRAH